MEAGLSLFEIVFVVVQQELDTGDDATLDIVHQRLVDYTKDLSSATDVMEIEGAIEVLDPSAHQLVRDPQDEVEKMVKERKSFRDMWKDKRQSTGGK